MELNIQIAELDALAIPAGVCLLEKRFADVTIRYGVHSATIDR